MKTCQQCGKLKPAPDYHLDKRTQRRASACRACFRASRGVFALWDVPDAPLPPDQVNAEIARQVQEMFRAKGGKR